MSSKKVVKWFQPTRTSGFKKEKGVAANITTMLRNLPRNWTKCKKLDRVRRQAQALHNISKDSETKRVAGLVAKEASKRYKAKICKLKMKK